MEHKKHVKRAIAEYFIDLMLDGLIQQTWQNQGPALKQKYKTIIQKHKISDEELKIMVKNMLRGG